MPSPNLRCPPNRNWASALSVGYTSEAAAWITAKEGWYVNQCAGWSASRVQTYMRQLRMVVLNLREKLRQLNGEIALTTKASCLYVKQFALMICYRLLRRLTRAVPVYSRDVFQT